MSEELDILTGNLPDAVLTMREKVNLLEAMLKSGPTKEPRLKHYFSPGIYAREITLDAGDRLVSLIHKDYDLNILSKGRIKFTTDTEVKEVEAPYTFVSPPGAKRAGYCLTDVVWTTISPNPTNERDIAKLEAMFVCESEESYQQYRLENKP